MRDGAAPKLLGEQLDRLEHVDVERGTQVEDEVIGREAHQALQRDQRYLG